MADFSIDSVFTESAVVVHLVGSADLSAEAALQREVTRLIAGRHKLVIVDLTNLSTIASLAIGQLLQLQRGLRSWGGCARIVNPNDDIRGVLVRARLTDVFPIHASVQAAIDAALE
ncbi:MAG: STAS domain-containing protein [Phycisphaerae bacterium]|nr:STAS domain-containing protein [Phycisphaerae bacterium]